MAYYNINRDKRNFLTRGFAATKNDLDAFNLIQDPTFLTFKVEFFFPGYVTSPNEKGTSSKSNIDQFLQNNLSHEGLLLPSQYVFDESFDDNNSTSKPQFLEFANPGAYTFHDSAEDYLYAIGSANRVASIRSFKQILYKLQTDAPWYFQKITGADALYKLDPGYNTRKDASITIECLESLDLRVSLLADLYRNIAFDFERHREVLPYNLRTFKMRITVLEMRDFNTTSGTLAGLIKGISTDEYYKLIGTNVTSANSNRTSADISNNRPNSDSIGKLSSAFDALSFQTYELGLCEFDFYSQAPSYLEDLNVTDPQQATFKFGIKYGTVRKTSTYSFYNFITDYVIRNSKFPVSTNNPFANTVDIKNPHVVPFYDAHAKNSVQDYSSDTKLASVSAPSTISASEDSKIRDEITLARRNSNELVDRDLDRWSEESNAKQKRINDERTLQQENSPAVRVGGIGGLILSAAESAISTAVNNIGDRINRVLLGNVYDNIPSPAEASQALLGFFNPDLRLAMGGESTQAIYDPGNVEFDTVTIDKTIAKSPFDNLSTDKSLIKSPMDNLPKDLTLIKSTFETLSVDTTLKQHSFTPLSTQKTISGGGFDALQADTTLSQSPMQSLGTDTTIKEGGLDNLTTNTDIIKTVMNSLNIDKTIQGGGMEGIAPNATLIKDSLEGQSVSSDIISSNQSNLTTPSDVFNSRLEIPIAGVTQNTNQDNIQGGGLDPIFLNTTVSQSPMEIAPKPGSVSPKSKNFEQPPSIPSISPKNVFRNN